MLFTCIPRASVLGLIFACPVPTLPLNMQKLKPAGLTRGLMDLAATAAKFVPLFTQRTKNGSHRLLASSFAINNNCWRLSFFARFPSRVRHFAHRQSNCPGAFRTVAIKVLHLIHIRTILFPLLFFPEFSHGKSIRRTHPWAPRPRRGRVFTTLRSADMA